MTENAQILASGVAAGCVLALVALGFVIVSKATGVLNIAQGGFVALGAYLTYSGQEILNLPFWPAVLLATVLVAVVAAVLEATIVHRVALQGLYPPILVTFGISIVVPAVIAGVWGTAQLTLHDPWGLAKVSIGSLSIGQRDLAVVVVTLVVLALFVLFFRFSRLGLAMQAAAEDPEAAMAQGISDRLVHRLAWAISGALGAIAGSLLATTGGGGVRPGMEVLALLALPVIIFGGLTSPTGAVVAGLVIGVVQQFAVVRLPDAVGDGFHEVVPYLLMLAMLLVRPQGLFGSAQARRI
ncbi:branched-chain amino acid ABC transporter permease [Microbispora sp. H10836]|uniref:branched-chain amino acid ABC transporter permease n=1 Tax=Microbispora sp. H10836 TaxID=2729106 RepID=UPI001473F9DD|nr:branched-chain amino acid ABC transporter permease [Microbispora sp. H10836]